MQRSQTPPPSETVSIAERLLSTAFGGAAYAFWVLDWLHMVPLSHMLESERHIIAASDRQRLLTRIDILVQATEQHGYMEAIGATMGAIATELRARWPETGAMEYYPAFR